MSTPSKSVVKSPPTPSKRVTRKSVSESSLNASELSANTDDRFRQQPHDIEIGVGDDDFEIDLDGKDSAREKRKRSSGPISPPAVVDRQLFEKPFKIGWGRELVIYGKPGSASKSDAEVCYFSPEGKKLRNELEIKCHLKKTKNKIDLKCFTFDKIPVYEEPFEIVRYTGKPKGYSGKSKNKTQKQSNKTAVENVSNQSEQTTTLKDSVNADKSDRTEVISFVDKESDSTSEVNQTKKSPKTRSLIKDKSSSLDIDKSEKVKVSVAEKTDERLDTSVDEQRGKKTSVHEKQNELIIIDDAKDISEQNKEQKDKVKQGKHSSEKNNLSETDNSVTTTSATVDQGSIAKGNKKDTSKRQSTDSVTEHGKGSGIVEKEPAASGMEEGTVIESTESTNQKETSVVEKDNVISPETSRAGNSDETLLEKESTEPRTTSTSETHEKEKTNHDSSQTEKTAKPKFGKYMISTKSLIKRPVKQSETGNKVSTENGSLASKENIQSKPLQKQNKGFSLLSHLKYGSRASNKRKRGPKPGGKRKILNAASDGEDMGPGKRRRTTKLPSRLRDYAVGAGKEAEESTVSEETTDSAVSTDEAEEVITVSDRYAGSPHVTILSMSGRPDPTIEEIMESVLGEPSNRSGNVAKKHTGKRKHSANSQDAVVSKKKKETMSTPLSNGTVAAPKKTCSVKCPGVSGMAPNLQCQSCLSVYHPKCVGVGSRAIWQPYTCQTCLLADLPAGSIPVSVNANTTVVMNTHSSSFMHITSGSALPSVASQIGSTVTLVNSAQGPKLARALLPKRRHAINLANARKQGSKPNQVSGQLMKLPLNVSQKLNLEKHLVIKYNGLMYTIPPSCFVTSGEGVNIRLPPGTLPEAIVSSGPNNPVSISSGKPGSNQITVMSLVTPAEPGNKSINVATDEVQPITEENEISEALETVQTVQKPPEKKRGRPRKRPLADTPADTPATNIRTEKYAMPKCHFQTLHAGFDCMLSIFEYLRLPDLLRATQVCRTWRRVATQGSLWRKVRLRGYRITDWQAAIHCFQENGTRALDMRGMRHVNDDVNRTWHELHNSMTQLACLRHIDFPQCPSSVLHTVTEKMPYIKHLVAESVIENVHEPMSSNAKLDLGKFAKLTELEVLKLRGSVGLVQPTFSFSGGLTELSNLSKVHTLCVTTLRDLPGSEFSFLGSLTNLETLSIGDCTLWTPETFEEIGKLVKLKFLRLEAGGDLKESTFGKALAKLKKLESLELFKFIVSFDLADSLQTMLWLRKFSIFSERNNQAAAMNSNTLTALSNMPFLTTVEWGIFDSANSNENIPSDAIPFMPPGESDAEKTAEEAEPNPEYASVNDLVQKLKSHLPETIIRVFRVPNVTGRKQ